jgi:MarR family transcriptional regulator for hemolysin
MRTSHSPRELGFALSEVTRLWRLVLDQRLRPRGLSQATFRALVNLARLGDGVTQRALAERIGIEGPSLVRLLDALEANGLVERRPQPMDRRAKALYLTEKARAVLDDAGGVADDVRAEILDGIAEAELTIAISVLDRIAANAEGASLALGKTA